MRYILYIEKGNFTSKYILGKETPLKQLASDSAIDLKNCKSIKEAQERVSNLLGQPWQNKESTILMNQLTKMDGCSYEMFQILEVEESNE